MMAAEVPAWMNRFAEIARSQVKALPAVDLQQDQPRGAPGIRAQPTVPIYRSLDNDYDYWELKYEGRAWSLAGPGGMTKKAADRQALEETLIDWHQRMVRYPATHCAGCGESLPTKDVQHVPGSPRLHPDQVECKSLHERRWRAAGIHALRELGVPLPRHLFEGDSDRGSD